MEYLIGLLIISIILVGTYFIINEIQEYNEYKEYKKWKKFTKYKQEEYTTYFQQETTNNKQKNYTSKYSYDFSYMPYKKANLLTKTEYTFLIPLLKECNKRKLMVCPKVRLEDIAYVTDTENRQKYRGYVRARHIDFILVNTRYETIAGIELDDSSHNSEEAAIIDEFKNKVFITIGVPLIRINVGTNYQEQICMAFDELEL